MKRTALGFGLSLSPLLALVIPACGQGKGTPQYTTRDVAPVGEKIELECDCTPKELPGGASPAGGAGGMAPIATPPPEPTRYGAYQAPPWILCKDGAPAWEDAKSTCACNADADEDGDGLNYCADCDDEGGKCLHSAILMVPDGLGYEQIKAARMYLHGADYAKHSFEFEKLPHSGQVTTFSANSDITDSAASATAYAAGVKVNNGAIGFNGQDLQSVLELHKAAGKSTGLVTIYDSVLGATPGPFGAHTGSRGDVIGIAEDYCHGSRPNVLFGGGLSLVTSNILLGIEGECDSPYTSIVTDEAGLLALDAKEGTHFLAGFPDELVTDAVTGPTLAQRASKALELLEGDPDGFFLLVEHAETDKYGHANNLLGAIQAVIEFDAAVTEVRKWLGKRKDTILVIVPDHETGGLSVTEENPTAGVVPEHSYSTSGHSGVNVPIFAEGYGSRRVKGTLDNTEIYWLLRRGTLSPKLP